MLKKFDIKKHLSMDGKVKYPMVLVTLGEEGQRYEGNPFVQDELNTVELLHRQGGEPKLHLFKKAEDGKSAVHFVFDEDMVSHFGTSRAELMVQIPDIWIVTGVECIGDTFWPHSGLKGSGSGYATFPSREKAEQAIEAFHEDVDQRDRYILTAVQVPGA